MKIGAFFEGYEDRVKAAADHVKSMATYRHEDGKKVDLHDLSTAASYGSLEHRIGGKAHKDFVSDVKKQAAPHVASLNRSTAQKASHSNKKVNLQAFHSEMAMHVNDAIGNAYPDGDPFDYAHAQLHRAAKRHDIHFDDYDVGHHLDKAAKLNGYESFHHQVESTWDDIQADQHGTTHHFDFHPDDPDGQAQLAQLKKNVRHDDLDVRTGRTPDGKISVHTIKANPWRMNEGTLPLRLAGKGDPDPSQVRKDSGLAALASARQDGQSSASTARAKYLGRSSNDIYAQTQLVKAQKTKVRVNTTDDIRGDEVALQTQRNKFQAVTTKDLRQDLYQPRAITYKQVFR